MAESDAIAVVSQDWTPWLVRAPHIIQKLGICMSLAATREAAQIEFSSSALEYPDLASNLVEITNQGQNAFIEAYSDMLQIGSKTNSMGGKNGKLDDLAKFLGDPEAIAATNRTLKSIQTAINTCNASGLRTEKDFKAWFGSVKKLHIAVVGAKSKTNRELGDTEKAMKKISENISRATNDLERSNEETEIAWKQYNATVDHKKKVDAHLNSYLSQAADIGIAASFGMIGTIAKAGLSSYISASAAWTVQQAEEELERRRTVARELDLGLKSIEIDLDLYKTEKEGLDHLMGAIKIVLQLLAGLVEDIVELLQFFKQLNDSIANLVTEHEEGLREIADSQGDGDELQAGDYEQFYDSIKKMKKLAVTVHALASLYARVISGVINPGFSQVIHASNHEEGSSALVVSRKQAGMQQYIVDAEQKCRESAAAANQELKTRIAEIDRERPVRRHRKVARRERSGRSGFFSRFRFFRRR